MAEAAQAEAEIARWAEAVRAGFAAPTRADEPPTDAWAGRVRVAAWRRGEAVASAEAVGEATVALQQAASKVAAALADEDAPAGGDGDADPVVLDVEVAGELEQLQPDGLNGLIQSVELGIHGLVLTDPEGRRGPRVAAGWPSEAQAEHSGAAQWVKALLREARPPGARLPASMEVARFTVRRIAVPVGRGTAPVGEARELVGGVRLVRQDELSQGRLLGAATEAGFWLLRHQRPNGWFAYEFQPGTQSWGRAESVVRQAGTAWSVAALATAYRGGRDETQQNLAKVFGAGAMRAISGILDRSLRRGGPGRLFHLVQGGEPRLGAVPLLLLAITDLRHANFNKEVAQQLTQTLLAVQRPDGGFGTSARGLTFEGSERYFAGQIALALARRFPVDRKPRLDEAVTRALPHYRTWWDDGNADLSFAAWMLQACESHYRHTASAESKAFARDFAFAMADWALTHQHGTDHANPLWVGGYDGTPGIGTAAYTEGMLRALVIAKLENDHLRATQYTRSVATAARFLLQLQVEAPDLPFIGGEEQRGAVRASLRRRSLRCDNAQHFLMVMLRASALLTDGELRLGPPSPRGAAVEA